MRHLAALLVLILLAGCLTSRTHEPTPTPSSSSAPASTFTAKDAWPMAEPRGTSWKQDAVLVGLVAIEGGPGTAFYDKATNDTQEFPLPVVADPHMGDGAVPVWYFLFRSPGNDSVLLVGVYENGTVLEKADVEDNSKQAVRPEAWLIDSTEAADRAAQSATWRSAVERSGAGLLIGLGPETNPNGTRPQGTPKWVFTAADERGIPFRIVTIDAENGEMTEQGR